MKIESVGRMANPREILLTFDEAVTADQLQKLHDLLAGKEPHCSTCQCNRTHGDMPSHPLHREIKRQRSWHTG